MVAKWLIRYKWWLWSLLGAALIIAIRLFGKKEQSSDLSNQVTKIVIKKKAEILQTAIAQNESTVKKAEDEIEAIDEGIDKIKTDKEIKIEKINSMSMRELNDEFKSLY